MGEKQTIIITDIDGAIERQRDIEQCGEYGKRKRKTAKADEYIDPCADKACFPCRFEIFISCPDSWLHE
jgi:hypothetical protein